MRTKITLLASLAVVAGFVVAAVLYYQRETAPLAMDQPSPPASPSVAAPEPPPPETSVTPATVTPELQPARAEAPINVRTQQVMVQPRVAAPRATVSESEARAALSLVGADSQAEEIWITAINDPRLSANARQNLIEDLNEDGLSDPRNPAADDLPLIVSRLQLIEDLAPDAMDQVNWDAFMEAYKDLWNMYVRLTQR